MSLIRSFRFFSWCSTCPVCSFTVFLIFFILKLSHIGRELAQSRLAKPETVKLLEDCIKVKIFTVKITIEHRDSPRTGYGVWEAKPGDLWGGGQPGLCSKILCQTINQRKKTNTHTSNRGIYIYIYFFNRKKTKLKMSPEISRHLFKRLGKTLSHRVKDGTVFRGIYPVLQKLHG